MKKLKINSIISNGLLSREQMRNINGGCLPQGCKRGECCPDNTYCVVPSWSEIWGSCPSTCPPDQ